MSDRSLSQAPSAIMPSDMCTTCPTPIGIQESGHTSQKKLWQLPRHSAVILAEVHTAWKRQSCWSQCNISSSCACASTVAETVLINFTAVKEYSQTLAPSFEGAISWSDKEQRTACGAHDTPVLASLLATDGVASRRRLPVAIPVEHKLCTQKSAFSDSCLLICPQSPAPHVLETWLLQG